MDGNPKQMIVERIKGATNILVTVSRNPSVDALAAALALTLMINKMDKHATAVFSGQVPPAISFLEPAKTFESNVNSLRDFIIALDKEKADRLRYKIEDDVVRIYITPYRTTISQDDLQFSQGDFNVDLIVALGVDKRDDLDGAIAAHGRILHDATVATINITTEVSSLGNVDWSDAGASSLCEMLMSLSEALQSSLLDQQIASALLTGIVAATDRFSNPHTNPKVMTMAAQLMAAGANQQLIAAQLELGESPAREASTPPAPAVGTPAQADGSMQVQHDIPPEPPRPTAPPVPPVPTPEQHEIQPLPAETPAAEPVVEQPASSLISPARVSDWRDTMTHPPLMGAALSATADEAQKDKLREETDDRNRTILSHDVPVEPSTPPVVEAAPEPASAPLGMPLDYEPSALPTPTTPTPSTQAPDAPQPDLGSMTQPPVAPALTIADLEAEAHSKAPQLDTIPAAPLDEARAAVDSALHDLSSPFTSPVGESVTPPVAPPSPQPVSPVTPPAPLPHPSSEMTLPPPPPLPDFSSLPPLPPLAPEPTQPTPAVSPIFPDLNPPVVEASPPAAPTDPGQFRLPGQ